LDAVDISLQVARRKMSSSPFTVMNQTQYTAQITDVAPSNHLCTEIETQSEMVSQLAGPSFKAISGRLAMTFAGILLGLVVAEFGLRLLDIGQQGFYQWDPDRGWALRPGAVGWQHREGNAFVQINHDGMRDREHSYQKPKDTIRIAFVGDSFTEAEQVALQDDFVSVVERRLGARAPLRGMKIEALNFGCDSYGTAQELVTLRRAVWKFSPDIVVLVFFAGNDIRNNSPDFEWHTTGNWPLE
jgi:hypothetical protein